MGFSQIPDFFSDFFVVRDSLRYQFPKFLRVVELFEMAKFMDNNVVQIWLRQMDNTIIEIQISFPAATSPARFLIADGNSSGTEVINRPEIINLVFDKFECLFFPREVFLPASFGEQNARLSFPRQIHLAQNPIRFLLQKIFQLFKTHPARKRRRQFPARVHGDAQTPRPRALEQTVFDLLVLKDY